MTATPMMSDPMDFIRLLNLLDEKQMPVETSEFLKMFPLNKSLEFQPSAIRAFQYLMKGKISYLNRSWDPRQFAQPEFHTITTPISHVSHNHDMREKVIQKCKKEALQNDLKNYEQKKEMKIVTKELDILENDFKDVTQEMENELFHAGVGMKGKVKKQYASLKRDIKSRMMSKRKTLRKLKSICAKADKRVKAEYKKCIKNVEKEKKEDTQKTQRYVLENKCKIPGTLL